MAKLQSTRHGLLRFGVFAASLALAAWLTPAWLGSLSVRLVLGVHLGTCLAAMMLPPARHIRGVRIGFLALDLVALVSTGYAALYAEAGSVTVMLPFLAAYVVATLVAFVGRQGVAATLGGLAGVMVLGMGLLFIRGHEIPTSGFVLPQLLWIALAVIETTIIASWLDQRDARLAISAQVERELKAREADASEIFSLVEALLGAASLEGLAEAVLRHLRFHVPVRAHAVALESAGEEVVIWEENGVLTAVHEERRRVLLQQGLARAGSSMRIRRLGARSVGTSQLPEKLDFKTAVDIPVRAGGRVAGVIYLADPGRGALASDRISTMAEVACRLGEALQRVERQRSSENRRVATLMREMREGVLLLGPDGQILLANPAARLAVDAAALAGHREPQLGDTNLAELGRMPPGITRRFRVQLPGLDERGPRELACTAVGVVENSARVGTLVTLSDVTDEELARRRLIRAERSTLVGQTLAGVAHELNNPLAAMLGYADLIKGQQVPPTLERPITRMCEQATRATRIVRNLLNFARRNNPQRVPTRVVELVEAIVELFAYEARMRDVEVVVEIPPDLPPVLADRHAIQQILVNLFQNAMHALIVKEGERILTISACEKGGEMTVSVRDNGAGVAEELRSQVFQPFFTTKGAEQGTGLGLALSLSIAREHGGDLVLAPSDGRGACFLLQLPAHFGVSHESETGSFILENDAPESVLVVDDEPSVRETLVAQIGGLGSRVDSASSSAEAERLISRQRYDVVLLDLRMPGSSGLDLHRALSAQDPRIASRVIFMTGDLANDAILSGVVSTGNALLEKPFTMDELKRALAQTRANQKGSDGAPNFTLTA